MKNLLLKAHCILFLVLTLSCDDACDPVMGVRYNTVATQANAGNQNFVYNLEVTAKDSARGTVLWSKTFTLQNNDQVYIPLDYPFYTFKALKEGSIPHNQYYHRSELFKTTQLAFEFLPESLQGFQRIQMGEPGTITFYIPDVTNRCRLYARADFAEGYNPWYVYADQHAIDRAGIPVAGLVWNDWWNDDEFETTEAFHRINLHDNTPYLQTQNYCAGIDYTASTLAPTINDVDISYYLVVSVLYQKEELFYDEYRKWKGQNNL